MTGIRSVAAVAVALVGLAVVAQNPPKGDAPAAPPAKEVKPVVNPLLKAEVGEWLEYVVRTESVGRSTEVKAKQTVIEKSAMYITLQTTGGLGTGDQRIPLHESYEPYRPLGSKDAMVTKLAEGDEKITVGGKSYECHWVKVRVVAKLPAPTDATTTVWTCPTVPVTGVVKLESQSAGGSAKKGIVSRLTMELVGTGKQGP
jgi:hypothetical protein